MNAVIKNNLPRLVNLAGTSNYVMITNCLGLIGTIFKILSNGIRPILKFGFVFIIFATENLFSQESERSFDFEVIYNKGKEAFNTNPEVSKQNLQILEYHKKELTPIQIAQSNYLRLMLIYADTVAIKALNKRMFSAPDTLDHIDSLIYSARKHLEKSMPDNAIHLLMDAIDTLETSSEKADYCKISLSEAYRQKQEYNKGIVLLNEILNREKPISDINRAYAYNRLAAIYDEWGINKYNIADSVEKYSNLGISLSEKINSKSNLALSQNELCYRFTLEKKFDKALELSKKAIKNFDDAGMVYSEMSALINLSNIYIELKDYNLALQAVIDATNLCEIEENRNLFMRLYLQFALIYNLTGNYKDAYNFMALSRLLLDNFYKDRISTQINEQSAKYDLFTKEQKIREGEQKNEYNKKQLTLLIIILIFISIAFIVSFFYFRLKRKEFNKQKLIEAVIETEEKERKRIASDLHDGLGPLLSAAKLYFQAFIDVKDDAGKKDIESKLKNIIENAISDTSRISHNISPQILENHGLTTALENFISDISISKNIKFELSFEKIDRFDIKEELTIYRTISELINNTIKHAKASLIRINIFLSEDVLNLIYEDNGIGFSVKDKMNAKNGIGFKNMETRIYFFKGNISFESQANKGMKVQIKMPYKKIAGNETN